MNLETKLEIQAWLDGELPESEARRIAGLVERDAAYKSLAAELETMRAALTGNEPEVKLPESRDFYWSKIRREIERLEGARSAPLETAGGWMHAWRRWLMPLAGTAMVAAVAVGLAWMVTPKGQGGDAFLTEIENLSEDVGSYSFRAPGQNMLVVWVYDKAPTPAVDSGLPAEISVQ
jgi:negative regulator of sigma E activity